MPELRSCRLLTYNLIEAAGEKQGEKTSDIEGCIVEGSNDELMTLEDEWCYFTGSNDELMTLEDDHCMQRRFISFILLKSIDITKFIFC